jgi:hypothetical protein
MKQQQFIATIKERNNKTGMFESACYNRIQAKLENKKGTSIDELL